MAIDNLIEQLEKTGREIPGFRSATRKGKAMEFRYNTIIDIDYLKIATEESGLYFQKSKINEVHCGNCKHDGGGLCGSKRPDIHIVREKGFLAIFKMPIMEVASNSILVHKYEKGLDVLENYVSKVKKV
ncbi:MAG: hypothetical protein KKA79_04960 [Nanoarchaeota archaeon]|nr:hypothetical protein [Nanoarchaeota archaeon]MCG2717999.1 hypothetical protein [Nanoarchaeota archaeon]